MGDVQTDLADIKELIQAQAGIATARDVRLTERLGIVQGCVLEAGSRIAHIEVRVERVEDHLGLSPHQHISARWRDPRTVVFAVAVMQALVGCAVYLALRGWH